MGRRHQVRVRLRPRPSRTRKHGQANAPSASSNGLSSLADDYRELKGGGVRVLTGTQTPEMDAEQSEMKR